MILLVDNNDSFTYNVQQQLRRVTDQQIHVKRADTIECRHVERYSHIIFSPGPGVPDDFPIMSQILQQHDREKPILGICLGYQAICQYYGAVLRNLEQVVHGQPHEVRCEVESKLFRAVETMVVGRYHSWVAHQIPEVLQVTAIDNAGVVMAVEHISKPVYGVQFHPESYITKEGDAIIRNFLNELP